MVDDSTIFNAARVLPRLPVPRCADLKEARKKSLEGRGEYICGRWCLVTYGDEPGYHNLEGFLVCWVADADGDLYMLSVEDGPMMQLNTKGTSFLDITASTLYAIAACMEEGERLEEIRIDRYSIREDRDEIAYAKRQKSA